jgi:hypothetical protein
MKTACGSPEVFIKAIRSSTTEKIGGPGGGRVKFAGACRPPVHFARFA